VNDCTLNHRSFHFYLFLPLDATPSQNRWGDLVFGCPNIYESSKKKKKIVFICFTFHITSRFEPTFLGSPKECYVYGVSSSVICKIPSISGQAEIFFLLKLQERTKLGGGLKVETKEQP
jgi:hypothetical protein